MPPRWRRSSRPGLTPAPDTLEPDVKSVLTKVKLGEVDAGLVYRTDVLVGRRRGRGHRADRRPAGGDRRRDRRARPGRIIRCGAGVPRLPALRSRSSGARSMRGSKRPDGGPGWLWIPAAVAIAFLVLPLLALLLRVPWGSVGEQLTSPLVLDALRLSLTTALIATVLCIVFGVPLAWVLASSEQLARRAAAAAAGARDRAARAAARGRRHRAAALPRPPRARRAVALRVRSASPSRSRRRPS